MLHLLYILAFTCIAFLAMSSIIRSLITLSTEPNRQRTNARTTARSPQRRPKHPELLDEQGNPVDEPLLVIRSLDVDEAREKLDALYNASPSERPEQSEES